MFLTHPIKKIKGLFNSYRNEQVVPAVEYNANITALKEAIEHNGAVLEEHESVLKSMGENMLPASIVQSEHIAAQAITEDKLSSELTATLLNANTISSYFKDYLVQLFKGQLVSTSKVYGTFMNGSITFLSQWLKKQTTFQKTVEHTAGTIIKRYAVDDVREAYANKASAESYRVSIPEFSVVDFSFGWVTRYVLDQPYDISTDTDLCVIRWRYMSDIGSTSSKSRCGDASCDVLFKDAGGNIVHSFTGTTLERTPAAGETRIFTTVGIDFSKMSAQVFKNVKTIEVKTTLNNYTTSRGALKITEELQPTLTVNMRFSTGTSSEQLYNIAVPSVNTINACTIGMGATATTGTDFETHKLNLAPYCVGTCPHTPAPGFEVSQIGYIKETADSKYTVTLKQTNTQTNKSSYYIQHDFQAPLILSARISPNKPADVQPDFVAGDYYSWPLNPEDNSYISCKNFNSVVENLQEAFMGYIEDISYNEYSLGATQVNVQISTVHTDILTNNICVVRHRTTELPAVEDTTTFESRRFD